MTRQGTQNMQDMLTLTDHRLRRLTVFRWLAANLLVCGFLFSGLHINAMTASITPMWLASGAATALVFMRGSRILPGVGLGALLAYFYAGADAATAISAAIIWLLQTYILFVLSSKCISPSLVFRQFKLYLYFVLLCGLVTFISTKTLIMICDNPAVSAVNWWLANLNGILVLSVAVYTWDYYFPAVSEMSQKTARKIAVRLLLLMLLILLYLMVDTAYLATFLFLGIIIVLTKLVQRYGWCGGMAGIFMLGMTLLFAGLVSPHLITTWIQISLSVTTIYICALSYDKAGMCSV
jgi:hypothetical protein